ncbi:hypothetical protein V1524DRAFT_437917 [Lipomyces starkeyi]
MQPFTKFTVIACIGTYYSIAASLLLSLLNYIIIGWFNYKVDQFYLPSFNIVMRSSSFFLCVPCGKRSNWFNACFELHNFSPIPLVANGNYAIGSIQRLSSPRKEEQPQSAEAEAEVEN